MNEVIILGGIGLSVVVLIIVQALKYLSIPGKWVPLLSLALGIIGALAYYFTTSNELTVLEAIVAGIMAGAGASGLYSYGQAYLPKVVKSAENIHTPSN